MATIQQRNSAHAGQKAGRSEILLDRRARCEAAPRTWFASQFSGCTAFETDEGMVLVDTGTKQFAPVIAAMLRQKTQRPSTPRSTPTAISTTPMASKPFLMPGQKKPARHRPSRHARAVRALCCDRASTTRRSMRASSAARWRRNPSEAYASFRRAAHSARHTL